MRPLQATCPDCGSGSGYVGSLRRARSTLQLLSRFAVFMYLEARAEFFAAGGVPIEHEREHMAAGALRSGLLRVTWSQP